MNWKSHIYVSVPMIATRETFTDRLQRLLATALLLYNRMMDSTENDQN